MNRAVVQKEIETWPPDEQDELAAYLSILRAKRDPQHAQELARRIDDRNPESWLSLDAVKKVLGHRG